VSLFDHEHKQRSTRRTPPARAEAYGYVWYRNGRTRIHPGSQRRIKVASDRLRSSSSPFRPKSDQGHGCIQAVVRIEKPYLTMNIQRARPAAGLRNLPAASTESRQSPVRADVGDRVTHRPKCQCPSRRAQAKADRSAKGGSGPGSNRRPANCGQVQRPGVLQRRGRKSQGLARLAAAFSQAAETGRRVGARPGCKRQCSAAAIGGCILIADQPEPRRRPKCARLPTPIATRLLRRSQGDRPTRSRSSRR